MNKNILSAVLVGGALSASSAYSQTQEQILIIVNQVLSYGEHSINNADISNFHTQVGRFRYVYGESGITGCREFSESFDKNNGQVEASMCLSMNTESHGVDYELQRSDNITLYAGVGVVEYSDFIVSARLGLYHSDVGAYIGEVSENLQTTLYDPFISLDLEGTYPLGNDYRVYGEVEGKYGVYTHSGNAEVGVLKNIGSNVEILGGIGVQHFGVHKGEVRGDVVDTFLGGTHQYITGGMEYCPVSNICMDANVRYGIGRSGEGNTYGNIGLYVNF